MRQGRPAKIEERKDVGAKCLFQLLRTKVSETLLGMLFGGVVHQYVQLAELLNGLANDCLTECLIANVTRHGMASCIRGFDKIHCATSVFVLIQIHDNNVSPFFGKSDSDSFPDSAVASSHYGNLALQLASTFVCRHLVARLRP